MNAVIRYQVSTDIKVTLIAIFFSGEKMEVEETCHDQYHAQPAGGSTDCRIEGLQSTHICVPLSTEGESLDWLKLTISNIWAAALDGQWRRRQAGSAAGGVVTCGLQKGESLTRQTPTERNAGLLLKALLSHTFIRF